jgi:hypothetical protein
VTPSAVALVLAAAVGTGPVTFVVTPAGPGPQRLDVPPALLSASARGDLADLRLRLQDGGREDWAYLLVPPPDEAPRRRAAARIRAIPATKKSSGAELDLGAPADVAGVRLDVPARASFVRALRVEGSVDGARWTTLVAEGAVWALEREGCVPPACEGFLRGDELRFPAARVRYLRVIFDDRRAPPLPPLRAAEAILAPSGVAAGSGLAVPLAVARRDGEPGVSRFALVLPGPHLPVRAVRLDVDARHLFRAARVVEQRLEGGRLVPHVLGEGQLVRAERDGVTVAALEIAVARPEEQELELAVEDGDGGPLPLRGAQALLAPLPWIYLESPDGKPLEGRIGVPALAPHYDLEAIRPELAGARAAALPRAGVTFVEVRAPAISAAPEAPPDAAGPGAPLEASAFRIGRAVAAAAPGLAAVRLDAAALAASPDLSDVRLAAADGRQLPYLAESRPEPLRLPLEPSGPVAATPASRPGATVRALPLAFGAAPASRLVLETSARVFTRAVRVYADAGDGVGERRAIAEATWAHADPARPAPALTVELPPLRADRLLVALDDGDNAPLPITAATLLLPAWRLRFFHPGGEVRLLQGASGLAAPRYDLALLAPRLREAPAREVGLGPPPPPPRRMPGARAWFWIALGAAVLGLLALVARLVRTGPGERAPPAGS